MATGKGQGNHKVILLGEHSVVYGRPALGAALAATINVTVTPAAETTIDTLSEGTAVPAALGAVAAEAQIDEPVQVQIETSLPTGAGLGSSAALCVAHARALLDLVGKEANPETVLRLANAGERVFHGSPSGIDAWIATNGAPALYRKNTTPEKLPVGMELHMAVLVDPGRTPTATTVAGVRKLYEADRIGTTKLFEEIEALVIEGRDCLEKGDAIRLGRLMNRNHEILRELGVSTNGLDDLAKTATDSGALGAKLTGGGGGGSLIALAWTANDALRIAEKAGELTETAFTTTISS